MIITAAKLTLCISMSSSLKDKRAVLKKISGRTKAKFGINVAEIAYNDILNAAALGFSYVSNSKTHGEQVVESLLRYIESFNDVEVTEITVEHFSM